MSGVMGTDTMDLMSLVLLQVDKFIEQEEGAKISYMKLKKKLVDDQVPAELAGEAIWKSGDEGFIEFGKDLEVISSKEKAKPITITEKGRKEIEKIKKKEKKK